MAVRDPGRSKISMDSGLTPTDTAVEWRHFGEQSFQRPCSGAVQICRAGTTQSIVLRCLAVDLWTTSSHGRINPCRRERMRAAESRSDAPPQCPSSRSRNLVEHGGIKMARDISHEDIAERFIQAKVVDFAAM